MCVTGRISGACASATGTTAERQRSIRPPTTGCAVLLDACLMCTPCERDALRRVDREIDLPRQRLVRDLVGHLDLEPVIAFGKRSQRHGLAALQLVARRQIEL